MQSRTLSAKYGYSGRVTEATLATRGDDLGGVRWQTALAKSGRPAYVIAFACSLIVLSLGFWRPAPSGDESVTILAIRHGWRGHEDCSGFYEYYGVNPGRRDHAYHAVGHAVCPGCAALHVRGSIRLSFCTVLVNASKKPQDELRCLADIVPHRRDLAARLFSDTYSCVVDQRDDSAERRGARAPARDASGLDCELRDRAAVPDAS